jgi:predicted phosphodiesterase
MAEDVMGLPLAVVGDWHGQQGWGLATIRSAAREGVKHMVHVGDFGLDWPGAKRGRYENRLNKVLVEHAISLIVSIGNHDNIWTADRLPVQEDGLATFRGNIRVLPRGGRTTIQGLRIGGLGGALSVDKAWRTEGKDWWPNEEPTVEKAERLIAGGPLDILITHDAPAGVPVSGMFSLTAELIEQADRTRVLLRRVVDELAPPHVFCGHWHQRVTHSITHTDGRVTRVDVLDMENSREGNGVLIWPGKTPLHIEPLSIRGK